MNFYDDEQDDESDNDSSVSQWTDYDLYGRANHLSARRGQEGKTNG